MNLVTLGEVCEKITDGSHNPPKANDTGFPMLSSKNITQNGLTLAGARLLSDLDHAKENRRTNVRAGDVLMTIVGSIGRVILVDESHPKFTLQRSVGVLKPNKNLINPKYLSFALKSPELQKKLIEGARGVAQQGIYLNDIKKLQIPLPPLPIQQKIAAILDAADELRQKDKVLLKKYDELSQALFLEMFGDLKGEKISLSSVCQINPKKSEVANISKKTLVSFVPMTKVSETGEIQTSETRTMDQVWSGFTYFQEGDVLFAKITPCMENGKGAIAIGLKNKIGFGSTEFHVLRPIEKLATAEWLFQLLSLPKFRIEAARNMTGSAGQKRVPADFLSQYEIICPPIDSQIKFQNLLQNIREQKTIMKANIEKSEELFNSLLQKAFGGELIREPKKKRAELV